MCIHLLQQLITGWPILHTKDTVQWLGQRFLAANQKCIGSQIFIPVLNSRQSFFLFGLHSFLYVYNMGSSSLCTQTYDCQGNFCLDYRKNVILLHFIQQRPHRLISSLYVMPGQDKNSPKQRTTRQPAGDKVENEM